MLQWGPVMRGRVLICRIRPWFSGCGGRTASRARCENCSSLISFIARWPCCLQRFYYTISWGGCQVSFARTTSSGTEGGTDTLGDGTWNAGNVPGLLNRELCSTISSCVVGTSVPPQPSTDGTAHGTALFSHVRTGDPVLRGQREGPRQFVLYTVPPFHRSIDIEPVARRQCSHVTCDKRARYVIPHPCGWCQSRV